MELSHQLIYAQFALYEPFFDKIRVSRKLTEYKADCLQINLYLGGLVSDWL